MPQRPPAAVRRRRSIPQPARARRRPGYLDELRKALWSPSAPVKHKPRSYRAAPRLSSEHEGVTHPERIRATTNQVRIGDPVKRTRIRKQSESNFSAAYGL